MEYFTKPITNGLIFYVDPVLGSDSCNGLTPEKALQTVQVGIDYCSGKTHDYILLMPSSALYDDDFVAAASSDDGIRKRLANTAIYLNKPYVHIIGLQNAFEASVTLSPSAACSAGFFNVGALADKSSIENVNFTTAANALLVLASGVENFTVRDCYFRGGTIGIDADAGDCARLVVKDCIFEDQTTYGLAANSSKGIFENLKFITPGATSPTAFLYTTGNAPAIIGPNIFMNGLASASAGYLNNNVAGVMLVKAYIIGCTDNVSIGSGGNTGIVWAISKDAGQGAVEIGYDAVAPQQILITG